MEEKEPKWLKYMTAENLPTEELRHIAMLIGLEATKKLMFVFRGFSVNFPQNFDKEYKKQYILDTYNGTNKIRKQLALECKVSERHIYQIIKDNAEGKK